ncbi:hypothetical protein L6452_28233 [Arctium lappa]|uniref:Uncharacterized protein n=1 Tax=Arctium lappa TaxID=4217 RepID=A0ACB8ZYQ1_ARCLA|nr:hypothetical protein L6452_28233 [Arctium lappa]
MKGWRLGVDVKDNWWGCCCVVQRLQDVGAEATSATLPAGACHVYIVRSSYPSNDLHSIRILIKTAISTDR